MQATRPYISIANNDILAGEIVLDFKSLNWKSLKAKTALLAFFLLITFTILGGLSLSMLNNVNQASTQIREHWLESTRIIGDLNNFTSDFRAIESNSLLTSDPIVISKDLRDIEQLSKYIQYSQDEYLQLQHDPKILAIYKQFANNWAIYKVQAKQAMELLKNGNQKQAREIYLTSSQLAYSAVSETLARLTNETVLKASEASDYAEKTYERSQSLLAFALTLGFTSLCIALAYIRKFIALPLLDLAQNMTLLAKNNLSIEISQSHRSDEIGEMARATLVFQEHARILNEKQEGLLKQTIALEEKLEIERQMTELQRNFISMVSHEFRTPLTVIDGQAQRLNKLKEKISANEIEERSTKIRAAVTRLTKVLEGILDTTRIYKKDSGLPFSPELVNVYQIIQEACNLSSHNENQSRIHLHLDNKPVEIFGDANLLFIAIGNILTNALKYSSKDSSVDVTANVDKDTVHISISDKGLGIPEKDLPFIFERYRRGTNISTIEGSGIGLHLVKTIIDLHGGKVTVRSEENKGSIFNISIPLIKVIE